MAETPQQQKQQKPVTQVVSDRVEEMIRTGKIDLPEGYSAHNAIMNAWLILQQTQTKNKQPVLEACTRPSIMQSLFDMVVQGLDPSRHHGYFIAYGQQLVFQKSYLGHKMLAKRLDPRIYDIPAEVIWPEDDFQYEIDRGQKKIVRHVQSLDNIGNSKTPKGAYAQAIDHQGNVMSTLIMTWEQIKAAWSKSKMNPVNTDGSLKPDSTHAQFLEDMTKKTVLGKLSRHFVATSVDGRGKEILQEAVEREGQIEDEYEAEAAITDANSEELTLLEDQGEGSVVDANYSSGEAPASEEEPPQDEKGEPPADHGSEDSVFQEGEDLGSEPGF